MPFFTIEVKTLMLYFFHLKLIVIIARIKFDIFVFDYSPLNLLRQNLPTLMNSTSLFENVGYGEGERQQKKELKLGL